jgi:uncharacterized protein YcbK (DUF882 family)
MQQKKPDSNGPIDLTRRSFVKGCAMLLPAVAVISPWNLARASATERTLAFHHTHTGENLTLVYHDGADYLPDALDAVSHLLRDFRSEETHPIDPALLDILSQVRSMTGEHGTFEVISGYRSPATNSMLRRKGSGGVAKRSLHMQGKAIDVRLTGVDSVQLRKASIALAGGGVGYYSKSDFVHLDTGRFRTW